MGAPERKEEEPREEPEDVGEGSVGEETFFPPEERDGAPTPQFPKRLGLTGKPRRRRGRTESAPAPIAKFTRTEPESGQFQKAGVADAIDDIGRYQQVVRWDSMEDDPALAGLGQNAGTLYRYYNQPSRGRPVLYRMSYYDPSGRYQNTPFRLDEAVKIERGTDEYNTAIEQIETAYRVGE